MITFDYEGEGGRGLSQFSDYVIYGRSLTKMYKFVSAFLADISHC